MTQVKGWDNEMSKDTSSIEFASYLLGAFGFLFSILGVVFGFAVNRILGGYDKAHERNDEEHERMRDDIQQNCTDIGELKGKVG